MAKSIGAFDGPFGETGYWHLPNRGYEWDEGYSLGPYTQGEHHERTWLGERINRYKYWDLNKAERVQIGEEVSTRFLRVLWEVFGERRPFGVCLAIPGNRGGPSLPHDMCHVLAHRYDWIVDASNAVIKNRELGTVKPVSKKDRAAHLSQAWSIEQTLLPLSVARRGILVIDDVYDTGATLREMSRTLRRAFQREPQQYMVALSHVITRDWNVL